MESTNRRREVVTEISRKPVGTFPYDGAIYTLFDDGHSRPASRLEVLTLTKINLADLIQLVVRS